MYIVLEIQVTDTVSTIATSFNNQNEAESKYHDILRAAAISDVPKHGAVLIAENSVPIKHECYFHGVEAE